MPCIVNTETLFNTNVLHRNNPLEKSVCDGWVCVLQFKVILSQHCLQICPGCYRKAIKMWNIHRNGSKQVRISDQTHQRNHFYDNAPKTAAKMISLIFTDFKSVNLIGNVSHDKLPPRCWVRFLFLHSYLASFFKCKMTFLIVSSYWIYNLCERDQMCLLMYLSLCLG